MFKIVSNIRTIAHRAYIVASSVLVSTMLVLVDSKTRCVWTGYDVMRDRFANEEWISTVQFRIVEIVALTSLSRFLPINKYDKHTHKHTHTHTHTHTHYCLNYMTSLKVWHELHSSNSGCKRKVIALWIGEHFFTISKRQMHILLHQFSELLMIDWTFRPGEHKAARKMSRIFGWASIKTILQTTRE